MTLDGNSLDIAKEKTDRLRAVLPEVFSEGKVDFEKLKAVLGEGAEFRNERYTLNWAGKSDAFTALQTPSTETLIPDFEASVDFEHTKNIFIEGENLETLKVLQRSYFGKVKMIYIDPPYNTGNDSFIYPDKFSETLDAYRRRVGDTDEAGFMTREGRFAKNGKENGQYHSHWLSMMYPRLFLAKNLLRDDGVIFVSIDDNEVHNLRLLMNEIFGEENFIAQFIWNTKKGAQGMMTKNRIVSNHEYVLIYAKQAEEFRFLGIKREENGFSNPDNDERGLWKRQYLQRLGQGLSKRTIVDPDTQKRYTFETPYAQEKLEKWIYEKRIIFPKNESGYPARKEFLTEYENNQQLITSLGLFATKATTEKLYSLFDDVKIFTNPKPESLIKFFLTVVLEKNDIVFDFFAGSGTTAQAVMELNAENGGNRRYVCVQMPEPCDEKSEAFKAGYKTIADIAKERIRRAGKRIAASRTPRNDDVSLDTGFKAFRLGESNFVAWSGRGVKTEKDLRERIALFSDSLREGAGDRDILCEILLKYGFDLNVSWEEKEGYAIARNEGLVVALHTMNDAMIDAIVSERPQKVVVLDRIFSGNDALKTNLSLQLKDNGIEFRSL